MRHGLTVIILTRNEKKNIEDCIASVKFADDMIIVDSGSEDNTRDIAQKCGARVFLKPFENFAAQRNFGLSKVETDWVFYLDADERVLPEIREEILKAVNLNERFSYRVQRRQIIFGERVNYGGHGPDYVARLFPTDAIKWEGIVHEGVVTDLESKTIAGHLEHYTYESWDKYFEKFNQYTTLMAEKMYQKGKKCTFADIILHPIGGFLKFYVFNRGFLDGKIGFILAAFHYAYTMAKYVKLYYMCKK